MVPFLVAMVIVSAEPVSDAPGAPPPAPAPEVAPLTRLPRARKAEVERYEDSGEVPDGYHRVKRYSKALLITGGALFVGAYVYSAYIGSAAVTGTGTHTAWPYVPLVGPLVTSLPYFSQSGGLSKEFGVLLVALSVAQVTGVALAVVGLLTPASWLERDLGAGVSLSISPGLGGGSALLRF